MTFKASYYVAPACQLLPVSTLWHFWNLPCICQAASYCLNFLFLFVCLSDSYSPFRIQLSYLFLHETSWETQGKAMLPALCSHSPEILVNSVMATFLIPPTNSRHGAEPFLCLKAQPRVPHTGTSTGRNPAQGLTYSMDSGTQKSSAWALGQEELHQPRARYAMCITKCVWNK